MWPALAQAGASLISGFFQQHTNAANAQQLAQQNQFNANQAQINRDFQERMSDTQFQRQVADMRAAGLNPAAAYLQGGAGTPSGSTASSAGLSQRTNPAANASAAVSSALDAMNQLKQGRVLEATAANQQAQAYDNAMAGSLKALDNQRLSDDSIQNILKGITGAQLKSLQTSASEMQARAGSEDASAAATRQNTAQTHMNEGWVKTVQPWINDAQGAARIFREVMAGLDPIVGGQ